VRGKGGQRVALPLAGGEAAMRVWRILRRMRPAVHPDHRLVAITPPRDLPREQLLGNRIRHHCELQRERADDGVDWRVHLALALGRRERRDVVAQRLRPAVSAERHAQEIDRFARGTVVVLSDTLPGAGEIDLGVGRRRHKRHGNYQRSADGFLVRHPFNPCPYTEYLGLRTLALTFDLCPLTYVYQVEEH